MFSLGKLRNHSKPSTPLTLLPWTDRIAFVMCLISTWHITCTQQRISWDSLNFSYIFSFSCLETFSGSLLYRAEPGNCVLWTDLAHRHILFGPCREYLNWLSMSKSWEFTYKLGFLAYLEMLKTLVTLAGIPACSLAERSSGCPFCNGCVLFHYHCFTLPALIFIEGKFTQHKINHLQ